MDEFESTIAGNPPASRLSVVYDPRDGRIVYTHEVIGGGRETAAARAAREKAALASAAKHRPDVAGVRVLHLADGFKREAEKRYRVDAKAGKLVVQADLAPGPRRGPRPTSDRPRAKPRSRR